MKKIYKILENQLQVKNNSYIVKNKSGYLEVNDEEWIEYFHSLTPTVKENYLLGGFYEVEKNKFTQPSRQKVLRGIPAMVYKGFPVVRKSDL